MSEPAVDPEEHVRLRPYRVAMYALFFGVTFLFIGLVLRSVALDIYGRGPSSSLRADRPPTASCVDEIDALYRKLAARSSLPFTPRATEDWTSFSTDFEKRLDFLKSHCELEGEPEDDVQLAIAEAVGGLDTLRLHLSRCGEEGDADRKGLSEAVTKLREAVRRRGH